MQKQLDRMEELRVAEVRSRGDVSSLASSDTREQHIFSFNLDSLENKQIDIFVTC